MRPLTVKQRRWLTAYVETGNATEAALRSYATTDRATAQAIGSELLPKPAVIGPPRCGGRMRVIATIEDPTVIRKSQPPRASPPTCQLRAPHPASRSTGAESNPPAIARPRPDARGVSAHPRPALTRAGWIDPTTRPATPRALPGHPEPAPCARRPCGRAASW